jgi:hypothetical protein
MNTFSETKAQVQVAAALQQVIYLDGLVLLSASLNDAVFLFFFLFTVKLRVECYTSL